VQREEEDESDSNDTVCWLGQLIGAVVFAVLFGALGFVLCGGNERCGGSIIGQV
jgi:formate/nitrite transporter FocA (FNT family)